MRHLSEPAKIAIITKALNRGETPLKDIAKMNNVGSSTLNRWLRNYHKKVPLENKGSQEITVSEKFHQHSAAGFKKQPFCKLLGICYRTFQRWKKVYGLIDHRRESIKREPANKLAKEEVQRIFTTLNSSPYRDMSPCKIVPALADQEIYLASESTFYRLFKTAHLTMKSNT